MLPMLRTGAYQPQLPSQGQRANTSKRGYDREHDQGRPLPVGVGKRTAPGISRLLGARWDAPSSIESNCEQVTIRPRRLEQVVGEAATKIDKIARLSIDVDGHHEDVWGYVIPGQSEDLILGKGWLARHDASIRPAREEVIIRRPWTGVLKTRDVRKDVNEISVAAFRAYRVDITTGPAGRPER